MAVEIAPLPPKEALAFWRTKTAVTKDEYTGLEAKARARAFTVAGLSRMDQIGAVQAAMHKALEDGETLHDFKKRLDETLQGAVLPNWRLKTIYRTNIQSAYMAGRYAQMRRAAKSRPFWRYMAVADNRTRPDHMALNGMVYPADHAFWDTYYPPNGFGCRCTVQSLSGRQVAARGLSVETGMPDLVEPRDPATGNPLPPRRPRPDPGFTTNVGQDWLSGLSPSELDANLKDLTARAYCRDGLANFAEGDACRPPLASLDKRHIITIKESDLLPKDLGKAGHVAAFLKEFGLGPDESAVHYLLGKYPVAISKWLFMDKASGQLKTTWGDKGPYMRLLARTIKDPFEVWWTPVEIGGGQGKPARLAFSIRLLRLFSKPNGKGVGGYCAFNLIGRKWLGATSFAPKANRSEKAILEYLERMRGGVLLYREELK
jgi:SPP1 gp7 family putative phage head morphogenesis protein